MKDMVISSKEKKDMHVNSVVTDAPQYPYGLKLFIDERTYEKLELRKLPQVGEKFMIMAVAEVTHVSQTRNEGSEKSYSMELQIMGLDLKERESEEKQTPAYSLYGG